MPHTQITDPAELARALGELADRPELVVRSDELRELAADLAKGDRLADWAELDLPAVYALPPNRVAPVERRTLVQAVSGLLTTARAVLGAPSEQRLERVRELLRNRASRAELVEAALGVLVFCPLLVTWAALMEAATAYGSLAAGDPRQASRPFLQLWQTGFAGRLPSWARFDHVATTAVVLISALLVTAVVHAGSRRRQEWQEAERAEDYARLGEQLVSLMTRVQLYLAQHRLASPHHFAAELSKGAARLARLTKAADQAQLAAAAVTEQSEEAAKAVQQAIKQLSGELPRLADQVSRVEAAIAAGLSSIQATHEGAAQVGVELRTEVTGLGVRMDGLMSRLTEVQGRLLESSEATVNASERTADSLIESARGTAEAVEGMRLSAERWDAAAAHWEDAASRVGEGVHSLLRPERWPEQREFRDAPQDRP